jgi:Immunoglobulin domain
VITRQPKNQRVHVGETATFTVLATGTPPLAYQWAKNGVEIPGAIAANYTTPPVTTEDGGSLFAVTVSDSGGSITSRSATLFVRLASSSHFPDRIGKVALISTR